MILELKAPRYLFKEKYIFVLIYSYNICLYLSMNVNLPPTERLPDGEKSTTPVVRDHPTHMHGKTSLQWSADANELPK